MKYNNRDVGLAIVAKVNYTNGFIRGFLHGQQLTNAIVQHDWAVVTAISLLWITLTILWTKFF